jgi:hypothetical protein
VSTAGFPAFAQANNVEKIAEASRPEQPQGRPNRFSGLPPRRIRPPVTVGSPALGRALQPARAVPRGTQARASISVASRAFQALIVRPGIFSGR